MPVSYLLAVPHAAHAGIAAGGYDVGSGRLVPTAAAVVGLISVIIGGRTLARAGRASTGGGRVGSVVALALGFLSAVIGGLHAAGSDGGLGTGNGLAGAIIAVLLGLIGVVTGGLALIRRRRRAQSGAETRPFTP